MKPLAPYNITFTGLMAFASTWSQAFILKGYPAPLIIGKENPAFSLGRLFRLLGFRQCCSTTDFG